MIKSPEEIYKKQNMGFDTPILSKKDCIRAMEEYHSQFRPTDEEIEKMFPPQGYNYARQEGAKQLRDRIFPTVKNG